MKALMWIIGIIAYFFLGWIAKDIIFSMIEMSPETTLEDIQTYEYAIYSVLSAIILITIGILKEDIATIVLPVGVIIMAGVIMCKLPYVLGTVILYNLINIGSIIWGVYNKVDD